MKQSVSRSLVGCTAALVALTVGYFGHAQPAASSAPAPALSGSALESSGPPPLCKEVCERTKLVLAECSVSASSHPPSVLAEAGEASRIDQLDCAEDCAFWSEAEVRRVDTCFPQLTCDKFNACLLSNPGGSHVEPKQSRVREADGATMVLVPAGPFRLGVPEEGRDDDERVATILELPSYWIDRDEVTTSRYAGCVRQGACAAPGVDRIDPEGEHDDDDDDEEESGGGHKDARIVRVGCNWRTPGRGDHPVNCVNQFDAQAYCRFVGARLPSEVEWEKAARGPAGRPYPWGLAEPDCQAAHMDALGGRGCKTGHTAAAGSLPQGDSPWGVRDMAGNVWEWIGGHYSTDRYAEPQDDTKHQEPRMAFGILRGGGWGYDRSAKEGAEWNHLDSEETLAATNRFRLFKHLVLEGIGFRCAQIAEVR